MAEAQAREEQLQRIAQLEKLRRQKEAKKKQEEEVLLQQRALHQYQLKKEFQRQ